MPKRQWSAVAMLCTQFFLGGFWLGAQVTSPFPLAPPSGPQIYPVPMDDSNAEFRPIFDGKSVDGWETELRYWRVENGMLVGEVTGPSMKGEHRSILLKELP